MTCRVDAACGALNYSLSIVVPVYNEREVLEEFNRRLTTTLEGLGAIYEVVYVNDGSTDSSLEVLNGLRSGDPRISVVDLSRNFGKEIALTAGLDLAVGDAVVVIDADLQDPPELIAQFVEKWQEGFDVVYGTRTRREGETFLKKFTAHLFYRVIRRVSRVRIPQDTGDFRLMSRRAVDGIKQLREQHRFMKGLFAWIGFSNTSIPYVRDPRFAGETKWNYWKLWNFALEGLTSFTIAPLKVASYLGAVVAILSFAYATVIVAKTILYGDAVRGYPSLMVVVLFLGGVQLLFIGIMGEYVGRIFNEAKGRPLYLVSGYNPSTLSSRKPRAELKGFGDQNILPRLQVEVLNFQQKKLTSFD